MRARQTALLWDCDFGCLLCVYETTLPSKQNFKMVFAKRYFTRQIQASKKKKNKGNQEFVDG